MSFLSSTKKHFIWPFKTALFLLGAFSVPASPVQAQHQLPGKIHFGLVYPLSTNGTHAPLDTNNFSINLLAGVSAAEHGPAFAGLSNVVLQKSRGSLFAGFSNHVNGPANGALFAGFMNTYRGGSGSAFAGFSNFSAGPVQGTQFAGFINTSRDIRGAQFAGFANISGNVGITQVSGFINTAQDVNGSQIAGFINIARKVKGVQLAGFMNIADSSDCPIGIINLIKHGEKSVGVTLDESQTAMLSFRSGGKVLYGIIGAGYNFRNKEEVYAFEAGLGAHFFSSAYFRINFELSSSMLESFEKGEYFKSTARLLPALKLGPFIEIFGGPALHFISTNTEEGRSLTEKYLKEWPGRYDSDFRALYLGYTGGIQLLF